MSGLDKDRKRNQTICFRMSPEERRELEARIIITGMPKGRFFIESVLHQQIQIAVGKYQSDRLSLEVRRLKECIENIPENIEELHKVLLECKALMEQFIRIVEGTENMLQKSDSGVIIQIDDVSEKDNAPADNKGITE